VEGMVAMLGDSMFNYAVDRMVKLHAYKVVVLGFLAFSPLFRCNHGRRNYMYVDTNS
jgi:hypothetical protein